MYLFESYEKWLAFCSAQLTKDDQMLRDHYDTNKNGLNTAPHANLKSCPNGKRLFRNKRRELCLFETKKNYEQS